MATTTSKIANPFKVGDIFHKAWGYGMTINSFYKVVKVTPKTVTVREIIATERESKDGYTGTETPNGFDPFDVSAPQADRGCCL